MIVESIGSFLWALNIYFVYVGVAMLTIIVIVYKLQLIAITRAVALTCWYIVIILAISWLVFNLFYLWTHNPRDIGLQIIARIGQLMPVYACALIISFMYPRERL